MSLAPYTGGSTDLRDWVVDVAHQLLYEAYRIYYWLRDIAPILLKYQLKQMGRDGVDRLPLLSWETKQEIKRWLRDYFGL
jgi:hypothetical protein